MKPYHGTLLWFDCFFKAPQNQLFAQVDHTNPTSTSGSYKNSPAYLPQKTLLPMQPLRHFYQMQGNQHSSSNQLPSLPIGTMAEIAETTSTSENPRAATPTPEPHLDAKPTPTTAAPHHHPIQQAPNSLWYRLHVLARDLRHFRSDAAAQARLDAIVDPSYISAPYFTAEEATSVKALDVGGQPLAQLVAATLEERLGRRMKKRVESGDYRVCAAHDLAPVFEKALGVSAKDVAGDAEFEALVREKGLQLSEGEAWPGLKKRGQVGQAGGGKKNKGKNKNGRKGWLGVTRRI